ncbi:PAS domain S-box protein [Syntrophomonas curvata]
MELGEEVVLRDILEGDYRLVAEYSTEIVDVFDRETFKCIYASPANQRILGYKPEELLGRMCLDLVHPDDLEYISRELREGIARGSGKAELRERKKDGSYIWAEVQGHLISSPDGHQEILLVSRDINDRKIAENTLREITDNMLDGIVLFDKAGIIEYASPSCRNLLGYTPQELKNRAKLELVHPEDRWQLVQAVREEIRNQSFVRLEFRCCHAWGHYIWVEAVGNTLVDRNKRVKGMVFAFRDINARKQAEQRIQENEDKLKDQYNYLNTLINNMNEFCYTYDRNYNLTFVNQKTIVGTGYSKEEMLGRPIFDFVHPEDREKVRNIARGRFQSIDPGRYEHRLICRDGRELLVRIKGAPIYNHGEITGMVVLSDDITEHTKMQVEMARLDQMHIVGEIAAGIAHEIRNPMTTVKGFLQLLLRDDDFSGKQEYLEIMIEELNRANAIIGEFLSMARNKMVDLKSCQLNQVIRSMAPLLQADAFLADRTIILKLTDIPDLLLDVKEIRQLIINLVRNALEATPRGGIVEIKTWQENDVVNLAIKDEGGGIPAEVMEKLGTPFISGKENGTGLGLAVCFGIIERHKATTDIKTSPLGTTFTVKFNCPAKYELE